MFVFLTLGRTLRVQQYTATLSSASFCNSSKSWNNHKGLFPLDCSDLFPASTIKDYFSWFAAIFFRQILWPKYGPISSVKNIFYYKFRYYWVGNFPMKSFKRWNLIKCSLFRQFLSLPLLSQTTSSSTIHRYKISKVNFSIYKKCMNITNIKTSHNKNDTFKWTVPQLSILKVYNVHG